METAQEPSINGLYRKTPYKTVSNPVSFADVNMARLEISCDKTDVCCMYDLLQTCLVCCRNLLMKDSRKGKKPSISIFNIQLYKSVF